MKENSKAFMDSILNAINTSNLNTYSLMAKIKLQGNNIASLKGESLHLSSDLSNKIWIYILVNSF
jgi:hypothetical protein